MGQPTKEKTLQDFKDEAARENDWYDDYDSVGTPEAALRITDIAAERYATYKEQRAKEAAWAEGWEKGFDYRDASKDEDAINPYREKGGDNEHKND